MISYYYTQIWGHKDNLSKFHNILYIDLWTHGQINGIDTLILRPLTSHEYIPDNGYARFAGDI